MSGSSENRPGDPHRDQPVLATGTPLDEAQCAMVMIHGRGAGARDILSLAGELDRPEFAYLAPEAADHTWYPYPFMSPIEQNEPWLSSALRKLEALLAQVESYISLENVILISFSQGACLTMEFTARHARRYGGVAGFSGGLIGPDGTPRDYPGSLDGTPVFLGCSDVDPHIPKERVLLTADVLRGLGADVTARLYPNMPHTINQDEIEFLKGMMDRLVGEK